MNLSRALIPVSLYDCCCLFACLFVVVVFYSFLNEPFFRLGSLGNGLEKEYLFQLISFCVDELWCKLCLIIAKLTNGLLYNCKEKQYRIAEVTHYKNSHVVLFYPLPFFSYLVLTRQSSFKHQHCSSRHCLCQISLACYNLSQSKQDEKSFILPSSPILCSLFSPYSLHLEWLCALWWVTYIKQIKDRQFHKLYLFHRHVVFYITLMNSVVAKSYHPWWKVDMEANYTIGRITLVNRGDCCSKFTIIHFRQNVYKGFRKHVIAAFFSTMTSQLLDYDW